MKLEKLMPRNPIRVKLTERNSIDKMVFEGMRGRNWYSFIKRKEGESILDIQIYEEDISSIDEKTIKFSGKNMIQKTYTPLISGYYYRKQLLVSSNLWGRN